MRVRATRLAMILLVVAACASEAQPPAPRLPQIDLPGMRSELAPVTAERLARDALEPGALVALLDNAGYRSGTERTYAGPGERFSLATVRFLEFADEEGAESYLAWLRSHTEDLLGSAERLRPLDLPGSFVAVHLPGGCCPKAVPIYLSAWRRGPAVLSVRASGREATADAIADLAAELDSSAGRAAGA